MSGEVAVTRAEDIQRLFGIGFDCELGLRRHGHKDKSSALGRRRAGHTEIIKEEGVHSHGPLVAVG